MKSILLQVYVYRQTDVHGESSIHSSTVMRVEKGRHTTCKRNEPHSGITGLNALMLSVVPD
jgi:hypothetical protein